MTGGITTAKAACRVLLEVVRAHGVRDVFCSPGSRNAPLLLAARALEDVRKHVVVDERTAAFAALGMAATSRRPVALICTSGTAVLNYAPAVAEAFYRSIPLVVISADRPMEWIDQDDSQTLRQFEALGNFVKKSYDIPDAGEADGQMLWYANRVANDAMLTALHGRPGPVHINVQLDAPLSGTTTLLPPAERIISMTEGAGRLSDADMALLADAAAGRRLLVVAGFMAPDAALSRALRFMASLPNVFVLAESVANIHVPEACHTIDRLLTSLSADEKRAMSPDIVVTLGGALVSRQIKEYLRGLPDVEHWMIGRAHTTTDCFRRLRRRIEADPAPTLRRLTGLLTRRGISSDYASRWSALAARSTRSHEAYVASAPWSDLKAFSIIMPAIPAGYNLHLSNGTPIRYAQLFRTPQLHASWCNRGVSGIDGCTATAIGSAMATPTPTLLISGDTSAGYDIASLLHLPLPDSLRMIIMLNDGGDIFRFIGATSAMPCREEYLCVSGREIPFAEIGRAAAMRVYEAASEEELADALPRFFAPGGAAMLLVRTQGQPNSEILRGYMRRKPT